MGFKVIKILLLMGFVILGITSTINDNYVYGEKIYLSEIIGVEATATKNKEEKPKPVDPNVLGANQYKGDLTGYAADCPACNGTLACKPSYKVYKNGVTTYNDREYGNVRIVASSLRIKCGSIVKFKYRGKDTYAIVLDRGVLDYDLDLLVETEAYAYKNVGRRNITYTVLRNGW